MVFSFSTRESAQEDTELVTKVKLICRKKSINFSSLIVKLIKQWVEEHERTGQI